MTSVAVPGKGPPCPRCRRPTQIRQHKHIGKKQLSQPFYYERWFRCTHADCKTNLITHEEFKVFNDGVPAITASSANLRCPHCGALKTRDRLYLDPGE